MKKWIGLGIGVLLISGFCFWGLVEKSAKPLRIATVTCRDLTITSEGTASIEPKIQTVIHPATGGKIDRIFVEEGDWIDKGQPLFRLQNAALVNSFEKFKIDVDDMAQKKALGQNYLAVFQKKQDQLNADIAFATRALTQSKASLAIGAVSKLSVQDLETQLNKLKLQALDLSQDRQKFEADLETQKRTTILAKAQVEDMAQKVKALTILAPHSGQLVSFGSGIQVGMDVAEATVLGTVIGKEVVAKILVDVSKAQTIRRGNAIHLLWNEKKVTATVSQILPPVQGAYDPSPKIPIIGTLSTPLPYKLTLPAVITTAVLRQVPTLPISAIHGDPSSYFVLVVSQKKSDRKAVKVFGVTDQWAYVSLSPGLQVVCF